jgi:glycosyltransferase involved in cell wall biosynthesis
MTTRTVLLLSGLPCEKASSFSRQLGLLGTFLEKTGHGVTFAGPCLELYNPFGLGKNSIPSGDVRAPLHGEQLKHIAGGRNIASAILLGYPDQFPFLHETVPPPFPVFLWAQFSRPPDASSLGAALPVPLTEKTAHYLRESGCSAMGPVIPHGVDTLLYRPPDFSENQGEKNREETPDGPVIGTVGAHTPRKRFGDIIETAALIERRLPGTRLIIKTNRVVSADGDDILAIARSHGMERNLTVIATELSDAQMRNLYGTMDLYVNCSEWEGFCIPVVEAMACGVPVASLPIQGPGEIIPYPELRLPVGRTLQERGSTLIHADTEKTAELLVEVLKNRTMRRKLGERGVREARKRYDIRNIAGQWEELINRYGVSPARQKPGA